MNALPTLDEKRTIAIDRAITLSMMIEDMANDKRATAAQSEQSREVLRLVDDALDILCNGPIAEVP